MSNYRHQGGEEYELRLVALADDVPPTVRLRRVLKGLLRHYGFRALSVRERKPLLPALAPGCAPAEAQQTPTTPAPSV